MSTAEWPRPTDLAPPPRVKKTGSRVRKRTTEAPAEMIVAPAPLAGFLGVAVRAIDAEKWPVHPVIWWQPELPLELPRSSGLRNERRHKVPMAGFLAVSREPQCAAGVRDHTAIPLAPELPQTIPASDLAPLGWDPRHQKSVTKGETE
jgi:hypothetical protein